MPILLGQYLNSNFPVKFISVPIHSVLETSGGIIAIFISMIFYLKYSKNHTMTHFNWSTTALLAMGIIDIFHAAVMPGKMFVWLHSTAVFFGGIFFMSVWIREKAVSKIVYKYIPIFFIVFPIVFSLFSIVFEEMVPSMINQDKSFSDVANLLNIVGGIGFFIASIKFIISYLKTQNIEEILFAGHTMLFGIAGVLFVSSVVWDMQWWLWHVLRLFAYIIAFYFLYIEYKQEIRLVEDTNIKLENANQKIQMYLDIVDKNVITSTTDLKGKITEVSQAFCDISGYSKEELIGQNHRIVKHEDMDNDIYKELWTTLGSAKVWKGEIKNKRKNGTEYWVDTSITPQLNSDGLVYCYTAVRHNITDKKTVEILSITDVLTGLYNRRYFETTIVKEISRAKRDGKYFSFLIMDIDYFKQYNDTYGHQEGDNVLQRVGNILNDMTKRTSDFAFRLGGEEFGIIFSGLNNSRSLEFAEQVRESIENLHIIHEKNNASKYVSVSIGLSVDKNQNIGSGQEIYSIADKLLYKAKNNGRNRVEKNI